MTDSSCELAMVARMHTSTNACDASMFCGVACAPLQAEADAMFHGLKAQGNKQVQYVLYPNEGHSLTHLPNRLDYYSRAEQLLADVLGGRRDEVLRPSKSTAKVKTRHRRLG